MLRRFFGRLWSVVTRRLPPVTVTIGVTLALVVIMFMSRGVNGMPSVHLFPGGSVNAAQDNTPVPTATPSDTPTDTPLPTPIPTATSTPLPTPTPVPPVIPATITCAHAQSGGVGQDPGTYFGELCVHTAPDSPISVDVSFCGVHAAQTISGMTTNANGDWSLSDTPTQTNPWEFRASCAIPFVVDLAVRGNAPNGDVISGSSSFTVTQ